jgi:hypothetical protein
LSASGAKPGNDHSLAYWTVRRIDGMSYIRRGLLYSDEYPVKLKLLGHEPAFSVKKYAEGNGRSNGDMQYGSSEPKELFIFRF